MIPIEAIFSISTEAEFATAAMETFRFQAEHCAPYRTYIELLGIDLSTITDLSQIPFLPIELFKTHEVYCGEKAPQQIFTSSNTGSTTASRHLMADLTIYEEAFTRAFRTFYGEPDTWSLYGLLPNYLQRQGSSLVYMTDRLIARCGSGGFYLDNYEQLLTDMAADPKAKILLGVSYALWDLAEQYAPKLSKTIIMETGGMKGHREELPKDAFHQLLCKAFGLSEIHSEYGMAELTSQAYSQGGNRFYTPTWMRVTAREINDPFTTLPAGRRGGINIIDLANRFSCAFIQTQDVGLTFADGSFTIEGRIAQSDIRGCNLLVQ
ncbi:MAG: acyltransferase [Alistipes sp.]